FFIGMFSIVYLITAKFILPDFSLTNKPAFYIALVTMILGTQFFLAGFLGELITRNAPERNSYMIEETLGLDA
ncbi:MAG: glycosyltransferase, partial [Chitinophagaceae bacterium]